jgi:2-polyprenyl-6-hydroxyphenyl methylase / 3-demethylubiquinone-9 3-methyltransferase
MINNEFYKTLDEKWFTAEGNAIALLRQEHATKAEWVLAKIRQAYGGHSCKILDVGCGGGFLTLDLARQGHHCTAVDVAAQVFAAGQRRDQTRNINWVVATAEQLPFADRSFDVVCVMDVLEHISDPQRVLTEASRVLRKQGILLLHTFNRTWLAWLVAAKGLDWFVGDSPAHIHDWKLFIKPSELKRYLEDLGMVIEEFKGLSPRLLTRAFLTLLFTRRVTKEFSFKISADLNVGYLASARQF